LNFEFLKLEIKILMTFLDGGRIGTTYGKVAKTVVRTCEELCRNIQSELHSEFRTLGGM
jgi:hypothetical protein